MGSVAGFEWDDEKNEANLRKHGIRLDSTIELFADDTAVDLDTYAGNDGARFVRVGVLDDRLLAVVYTVRGDTVRLISARRARGREVRCYQGSAGTRSSRDGRK